MEIRVRGTKVYIKPVIIMATIINNPPGNQPGHEDSSAGLLVGVIIALLVVAGAVLLYMYGYPPFQRTSAPATIINPPPAGDIFIVPPLTPPTPPPAPAPVP